ncbi:hypothetical protein [Acinetobacter pecorum]
MANKNNKHIRLLRSIKPVPHSPKFYLLSGFVLGVLSVSSVLLGYGYYQNYSGSSRTRVNAENHHISDLNHAAESEQIIPRAAMPLDQDNIQNPEDGFDQNIENMFKVAKPESNAESKNHTSPFESAFGAQEQKPLIQANDKNKPLKPEIRTIQSSAIKTKIIKGSQKSSLNINADRLSPAQTEKSVELKTTNTSSQEQPSATTLQESAEVALS